MTWEDPSYQNSGLKAGVSAIVLAPPLSSLAPVRSPRVPLSRLAFPSPLPPPRPFAIPNQQGDNDPVDLVEIGSEQLKVGGVYKVKPLW